jgi:hypothetical protein
LTRAPFEATSPDMGEPDPSQGETRPEPTAREARLAKVLRDNLRRRKAGNPGPDPAKPMGAGSR